MSKIEWERQPDGIIAGHADFVRYQAYEGEQETWQRIHDARVASIAAANGYVKLEPGQVVVDEHSFNDEEVDYLLEAIEPMKCNDCNEQCRSKARGMCLYLNIRAKLTEIKEARDE